jgi:hypothetical protein
MNTNIDNTAFSEVQGRYWNLTEVKKISNTINIDRTRAPKDIYTVKFEATHLVGTGAENFYTAAYVACNNHTLMIIRFSRIRDDSLYEMKNFTEGDYFRHLERVKQWDLNDGKLELHTFDDFGAKVILIFSQ